MRPRQDGTNRPTTQASRERRLPTYRFDHVLLWVKDEGVSKEFYAETLGFTLLNDDNSSGLFTVGAPGGFVLSFHKRGRDMEGTGLIVRSTGSKSVHFDFHVTDVDAAYEPQAPGSAVPASS